MDLKLKRLIKLLSFSDKQQQQQQQNIRNYV